MKAQYRISCSISFLWSHPFQVVPRSSIRNFSQDTGMTRHIDFLKELSESASLAGSLSSARGRYARVPDYTSPAARSSRPRSDRGTSFHFSHKAMSKKNDMSDGNLSHTTSAAHQGYIERPSATEKLDRDVLAGVSNVTQPAADSGLIHEAFHYPDRLIDPGRASFGTLGVTKAERKEFWNEVERNEGKSARIQNRIIAEIPVELDSESRMRLAIDFCKGFEERGLPYWAVVHEPGPRNDRRNYHLHVTYFDRPSGRDKEGNWSHVKSLKARDAWRRTRTTRPFRSRKHSDTRARDWPKQLRRAWADSCNFHLALISAEKRYDPRSYRDAGILKEPTEHLGNKRSALASMGLETDAQTRNAKREIRWQFARAALPWISRAKAIAPLEESPDAFLSQEYTRLIEMAEKGITHARKSASIQVAADLLTLRSHLRETFLHEEIKRLSGTNNMNTLAETSLTLIALRSESDILTERKPQLEQMARQSKQEAMEEDLAAQELAKAFDTSLSSLQEMGALQQSDQLDRHSLDELDEFTDDLEQLSKDAPAELADLDDFLAQIDSEAREPTHQTGSSAERENQTHTSTDKHERFQSAIEQDMKQYSSILAQIATQEDSHLPIQTREETLGLYPGAMALPPTNDRAELEALDKQLAEFDNRSLREAAIASRDASDLVTDPLMRADYSRGWQVLRLEARRRGLDLDTGKYSPENALDAERAKLHTDQDPCTIRVVRKNIERQRVLG